MSDGDIDHLFGIKKPFQAPLYLSTPLSHARSLSVDEAAQICERDSAIKPTTRDSWEIAPVIINGSPHARLSKMSMRGGRHAEATWILPLTIGYGRLRLSSPLGSGRAPTSEECRQLRSIAREFRGANRVWSLAPTPNEPHLVTIYRYQGNRLLLVGKVELAPPPVGRAQATPAEPVAHSRPRTASLGVFQNLIF